MSAPIVPLTPEQEKQAEARAAKEPYLRRLPVVVDIATDEFLGGPMGETISSRCARAAEAGKWWGIAMSRFLNLFQKDHGPLAQAGDIARAKSLEELEETAVKKQP
jgi:hypothetical protein